jgi:hypothetical protein
MTSQLTADLFISLDGFASGVDQPPFFGYFGPELGTWVAEHGASHVRSVGWILGGGH